MSTKNVRQTYIYALTYFESPRGPRNLLLLFQTKLEELGYGVPELSEPELLFLVEPGDVPLCAPLLMLAPFVVPEAPEYSAEVVLS